MLAIRVRNREQTRSYNKHRNTGISGNRQGPAFRTTSDRPKPVAPRQFHALGDGPNRFRTRRVVETRSGDTDTEFETLRQRLFLVQSREHAGGKGIARARFVNGRHVESWRFQDLLTLDRQ